jgi:hypothetical protein
LKAAKFGNLIALGSRAEAFELVAIQTMQNYWVNPARDDIYKSEMTYGGLSSAHGFACHMNQRQHIGVCPFSIIEGSELLKNGLH